MVTFSPECGDCPIQNLVSVECAGATARAGRLFYHTAQYIIVDSELLRTLLYR